MQKRQLIQEARQLCHQWQDTHHQLMNESNDHRKERLLHKELLLERAFKELVIAFRYCDQQKMMADNVIYLAG